MASSCEQVHLNDKYDFMIYFDTISWLTNNKHSLSLLITHINASLTKTHVIHIINIGLTQLCNENNTTVSTLLANIKTIVETNDAISSMNLFNLLQSSVNNPNVVARILYFGFIRLKDVAKETIAFPP